MSQPEPLEDRVAAILAVHPEPLRAADMADLCRADTRSVNQVLYDQSNYRFKRDPQYRWTIARTPNPDSREEILDAILPESRWELSLRDASARQRRSESDDAYLMRLKHERRERIRARVGQLRTRYRTLKKRLVSSQLRMLDDALALTKKPDWPDNGEEPTYRQALLLTKKPLDSLSPVDLRFVIASHPDPTRVTDAQRVWNERAGRSIEIHRRKRWDLMSDNQLLHVSTYHPDRRMRETAVRILTSRQRRASGVVGSDLPSSFDTKGLSVERLSFELLPPGSWSVDDVIRHYEALATRISADYGKAIDWDRLRQIKTLMPDRCYVGADGWYAYVVFAFEWTDHVVLECPVEGNAIYVLTGDWLQMARHSKQVMRTLYPDDYTRVIHQGAWLARVRRVLTQL